MAITAKELKKLDREALQDYVRERLAGRGHDPPYFPDRGEEPEYFLTKTFEDGNGKFRRNFKKAVVELLSSAKLNRKTGEYVSRLLYLIEYLNIREARPVLLDMWKQREKFKNIPSYHTEPDLFVQLIAAVTQFQDGDEFIEDIAPLLKEENYAPAAYTAMLEMDLDTALNYLPDFVKIADSANKAIWVTRAFEFLADIYGDGDAYKGAQEVFNKWSKVEKRFEREIQNLVRSAMELIPEYKNPLSRIEPMPKNSKGHVPCFNQAA